MTQDEFFEAIGNMLLLSALIFTIWAGVELIGSFPLIQTLFTASP